MSISPPDAAAIRIQSMVRINRAKKILSAHRNIREIFQKSVKNADIFLEQQAKVKQLIDSCMKNEDNYFKKLEWLDTLESIKKECNIQEQTEIGLDKTIENQITIEIEEIEGFATIRENYKKHIGETPLAGRRNAQRIKGYKEIQEALLGSLSQPSPPLTNAPLKSSISSLWMIRLTELEG